MTPHSENTPVTAEDRTVAILSYLTIIGFIVAIVIHGGKKTALGAYHLRQCLGLFISAVIFSIGGTMIAVIPILGWMVLAGGWVFLFALWLMGLIAAASGQLRPVPVLGANFQRWFANTFA